MATLTDITTQLSIQEAEQTALDTLLANLGFWIGFSEGAGPLWPFVALGFVIADIVSLFGGGRPKFQDTQAVINAYNESAYWPLHALASDLAIAMKNGAPISDSNPAIQAQFSAWKQGTITSIQNLAGWQSGASYPGYWQLQQLINLTWVWSAGGQSQVAKGVQAIDKFTEGLTQLYQQSIQPPPPSPPPPPPPGGPPHGVPNPPIPPGGGGGGQPPCPPFTELPDCLPTPGAVDQSLDEVGQGFAGVAYWLQILTIYVMNIFQQGPSSGGGGGGGGGGNSDPVTCAQLTGLFNQLITALGAISVNVPPGTQPDLTPIVNALQAIAETLAVAPGPLETPAVTVPAVPPPPIYGPTQFSNDLEAAKEQLLGETQVYGA